MKIIKVYREQMPEMRLIGGRCHTPSFMKSDEQGNVIMDYCFYVKL